MFWNGSTQIDRSRVDARGSAALSSAGELASAATLASS
jgi:hypothetical protein